MGEILTVAAFLKALRQSELLDEETLERRLREVRDAGVPLEHPGVVANAFVSRRILTRWQADMLLAGKHRGFVLGKYRLLSLLGQGGMGSVYLAEHRMMRRRCAIKVLPPRKSDDSTFVARFQREARAAATLDHVNIVRAYDIDKDLDKDKVVHFLVMEYIDGGNLQDLVSARGPLDFAAAANFIRQAADGLAHAHAAGVVHRDIKPANLLVDSSGMVKILDLGLAHFFNAPAKGTVPDADDQYVGTADYLAPEQALDGASADPRADLYSLGCTFYFLLAGHQPFPGGTAPQKLIAHQTFEPKPIEEIRPDIPAPLATILRKMMAKKRADRWQSAKELSQALLKWIDEQPAATSKLEHLRIGPAGKSGTNQASSRRRNVVPSEIGDAHDRRQSSQLTGLSSDDSAQSSLEGRIHRGRTNENRRLRFLLAGLIVIAVGGYGIVYLTSGTGKRGGDVPRVSRGVVAPRKLGEASPDTDAKEQIKNPSNPAKSGEASANSSTAADKNTTGKLANRTEFSVGPAGDFKTISDALNHVRGNFAARSGRAYFTIRVAGGITYPERLVIDNADLSFPNGVRLVSEGAKKAILAPDGREPVVKFTGPVKAVEQFTLEGFEIHADGKPIAIELAGFLVDTKFVNLDVRGFTYAGLLGKGVMGLGKGRAGGEFTVSNVLFRGGGDAVGMRFETVDTKYVRIENCRFRSPLKAGVVFRDGAQNIVVRKNIFCESAEGIVFEGIGPEWRNILIENNALYKNRRGIVFGTLPIAASNGLAFRGNLFIGLTGFECAMDGPFDAPKFLAMLENGGLKDNWTNRVEGIAPAQIRGTEVDVFQQSGRRGAVFQFVSNDPESRDFLKPIPQAAHRLAGPVASK